MFSSGSRAGHLLIGKLVVQSLNAPVCMPKILGKGTNSKLHSGASTGMWKSDRNHLRIEKKVPVWMDEWEKWYICILSAQVEQKTIIRNKSIYK